MNKTKILLVILIFLAFDNLHCQTKIEGIGIFKIDKTNISIIDSLVSAGYKLKKCSDTYSCSKFNVQGKDIYEMINDSIKPDPTFPIMKECKSYMIGEYTVANIKMTNIELRFYNDFLYHITVLGDLNLQSPLKEKYDGELKVDKKEVTCRSIYGEYKEEEVTYTVTYPSDENISAFSVLKTYFDDKCKKNTFNYTMVSNIKVGQLVLQKSLQIFKEREEINKKNKKELYKKL